MKNLRFVIVDYPKKNIADNSVKRFMGDMLQAKQLNYERTDENYVPFTDLDMISTHLFVYDTSNLFNPKQSLAIRICYESRCLQHNIPMPLESYQQHLPPSLKSKLHIYQKDKDLIDCGSMYLDKNWAGKKAGIELIKMGYTMMISHILKLGKHSMMATTNERFRVSRTLKGVGKFDPTNIFVHPKVNDKHLLVLMEQFDLGWLNKHYKKFETLYKSRLEILPLEQKDHGLIFNDHDLSGWLESSTIQPSVNLREESLKMRKLVAS